MRTESLCTLMAYTLVWNICGGIHRGDHDNDCTLFQYGLSYDRQLYTFKIWCQMYLHCYFPLLVINAMDIGACTQPTNMHTSLLSLHSCLNLHLFWPLINFPILCFTCPLFLCSDAAHYSRARRSGYKRPCGGWAPKTISRANTFSSWSTAFIWPHIVIL